MKKNQILVSEGIAKMQACQMGLRTIAQHALYYPGCDESVTDPSNSDCPTKELGDIRGYAFIHKDFTFADPTSTAEWTTGINARDIYVFNLGRGGLDITPNEQPGFGDEDTTVDGMEFLATIYDPQYKANWGFWDTIFRSKVYKFAYVTETQVHISENSVSIVPTAPIAEGEKKQAILWRIQIKWNQDANPQPYDAPSGVFDKAIAVT